MTRHVVYMLTKKIAIDLDNYEMREALRRLNLAHTGRETFPLDEPTGNQFPDLLDATSTLARGNTTSVKLRVWSDGEIEMVS